MSDEPDLSTTPAAETGPGAAQAAAVSAAAADATRPEEPAGSREATSAGGKEAGGPGDTQKPPARPAAEIRADIVRERAALGASFDELRADLDDMVDSGRQRAASVGRKAKIAAPAIGAAIFVALFLRSRVRDRR
jgi:hypothetical protein